MAWHSWECGMTTYEMNEMEMDDKTTRMTDMKIHKVMKRSKFDLKLTVRKHFARDLMVRDQFRER